MLSTLFPLFKQWPPLCPLTSPLHIPNPYPFHYTLFPPFPLPHFCSIFFHRMYYLLSGYASELLCLLWQRCSSSSTWKAGTLVRFRAVSQVLKNASHTYRLNKLFVGWTNKSESKRTLDFWAITSKARCNRVMLFKILKENDYYFRILSATEIT